MCGRFSLTDLARGKARALELVPANAVGDAVAGWLERPHYNIAPTQPVLVVRARGRTRRPADGPARRLDVVHWGLIPRWAEDARIGGRLANARAETLAEKPSFRPAWTAARRCLVFADGFYEWQDAGDAAADPRNGDAPGDAPERAAGARPVARRAKPPKRPHAIRMQDDAPFAFAGLWEAWRDPAAAPDDPAAWTPSCTLITTTPNALVRPIHDRMPVIVPPAAYDRWLDPALPLDEARAMLVPYPADAMRAYPVSTWVNDPRHDDPDALAPAA